MHFHTRPSPQISFIDITPFVDTVFNLLIFFALSLNFISTAGIRVDLPKSKAQEIVRKAKDLRVVITIDRQIYLNEKRLEIDELREHFFTAAKSNPQTQVLVQADEKVNHGTVVRVMDMARAGGLHRLAIITRTVSKPK